MVIKCSKAGFYHHTQEEEGFGEGFHILIQNTTKVNKNNEITIIWDVSMVKL